MRAQANVNFESSTTESVLAKAPVPLVVPLRELDGPADGIALGFRQEMLAMGERGKAGGVDTGSGLGTDFIILRWGEKQALVRGSELLRAWVKTFAPDAAALFPNEVKEVGAAGRSRKRDCTDVRGKERA